MNAKTMIRRCDTALQKLDNLESLLAYIPTEKEANRFVYESIAVVHELKHIARLETAHAVTVEQASHIQRVLSKTDFFLNLVPNTAKKELDGGSESQ